ncbi:Uncharacterised protein [Burkholderia pseudomallei]|nr:priA domain protein [Burkholderia pseudomallei]AJX10375.1 priA domain protein [Burkholderia pseudomallei 1026b]CAJ3258439.1 Uncharacterised protein [Burkholderia pseudomallei]CAJ3324132.1 Uncharacterised protein [Burkholderia pseudomallei]CAJ4581146.1 Uncharacterised protein [Burkholderia pseudomallei]
MRAAEARSQSTARRDGWRVARGRKCGCGYERGCECDAARGRARAPRAPGETRDGRGARRGARLCRRRCGRGRAPCRRVLRGLRGASSRAPPFRVVARMDCRRRAPLGLFRACISRVRSMKRGGEAADRAADRTAIYRTRTRTRTRDKARQKHPVPAPTRRLNAGGRSRCGCRARGKRASCRPGIAGGAKSDGRRLCVDDGMCVAGACAAWEATACARHVRVPDPRVSPWRVRAARALATSGTYASQTREFATYVYAIRTYAAALSETDACRLRQSSSRTLARGAAAARVPAARAFASRAMRDARTRRRARRLRNRNRRSCRTGSQLQLNR